MRSSSNNLTRRGRAAVAWLAAPLVVGAGLVFSFKAPFSRGASGAASTEGALVRRGPLSITITTNGNLNAADTDRMTSGVEGRTTILSLVAEGTQVKKGDVVCELDATAIVEKRISQSITVRNAEAALTKARQQHEIQKSQNRSDINKARQTIDFAAQDLQAFLEGERAFELQQGQQAIDLAREEAQRARDRLSWSEKLGAKGFLTATELEADRIAAHRGDVMLEQSTRSLDLLERFRMPRREAELRAAHEEAEQEGERVDLQAQAHLVDFESAVRTCEATLELEQEKLARLEAQVEKAKIRAPREGYVVYAQRDNDEPPIDEGAEVREREEILSIPSSDGMIASIKLHESVLKQVHIRQDCVIKVDALSGMELSGRVSFVAMLPDQNSRWSNPSLRLYGATVAITTQHDGLRPGMSCSVVILVEELADALYVPLQSVFRERDRNVSFVTSEAGIERREVRVGRFNELWVQVLDGLREGEVVALHAPIGFDAPTLEAKPSEKSAEK